MAKRNPLLDYIVALLQKISNPVKLSQQDLASARRKNFSITHHREGVELALLEKARPTMPFQQHGQLHTPLSKSEAADEQ